MRNLINAKFENYKVIEQYSIYKTVGYIVLEKDFHYKVATVITETRKQAKLLKVREFENYYSAVRYAIERLKLDIEFKLNLYK